MKRVTAVISLVIPLVCGLNLLVPTAIAMGSSDEPMGTIQVGRSASGEALRILSTAYTLRPLSLDPCKTCLGIVVGRGDLANASVVRQLKAAYEAGHGVAMTNATPAGVGQLHDILAHRGSAQPPPNVARAELVGFRKTPRADGQLHSSSHILLPRKMITTKRDKQGLRQIADAADIKALQRLFSAKPIIPGGRPRDNQQNLINLAESYESHGIQTDSNGDQVQLTNMVWAARSFQNSADFYYVNQEVDYSVNPGTGSLISWSNSANSSVPYPNVTLLQPSPQTTREATQVTSGVSSSIGVTVGFNEAQGVNASVTQTTTISNSNSTTVPAMDITNAADFSDASTAWSYVINDLSTAGAIDLYNNWIWQVPFSSYTGATQGQLVVNYAANLDTVVSDVGEVAVELNFSSLVPWPFGETFSIQPPTVKAVSPACVNSGNSFTIQGTGLYPSLVQAVLIDGTVVVPEAITTVSDTQINVIAPNTFQCHFGCPVAVQTNEGTSNTDVNIVISAFCGG